MTGLSRNVRSHDQALIFTALWAASLSVADFRIEHSIIKTSRGHLFWGQSRPALIPGNPARVIVTTQEIEKAGSQGSRNLFFTATTNGAKTWTIPKVIVSLRGLATSTVKGNIITI
jgi:esterase/lipase superfamily enzyme